MGGREPYPPEKRQQWLEAFRETRGVGEACRRTHIAIRTVYKWREDDEAFAAGWRDVIMEQNADLERSILGAAIEGTARVHYDKDGNVRSSEQVLYPPLMVSAAQNRLGWSKKNSHELEGGLHIEHVKRIKREGSGE